MPSVGLLQPHDEGVKVLLHGVKQREGVDDGLVLAFLVELDVVAGNGVADTEVGRGDPLLRGLVW